MGEVCGQCRHYRMNRYLESICSKTGKNVGYLWNKECFEPIPQPSTPDVEQSTPNDEQLTQNANNMAENANTKVCKVCGKELPIDQFRPNPKCKDGHLDTCYECLNNKVKDTKKKKLVDVIFDEDTPATQDKYDALLDYSAQELVDHLRFQGWTVTCTRTIEL